MPQLDDRTRLALKRLLKIAYLAALPVVIAALSDLNAGKPIDPKPLLIAVAIAILAAMQKAAVYDPALADAPVPQKPA